MPAPLRRVCPIWHPQVDLQSALPTRRGGGLRMHGSNRYAAKTNCHKLLRTASKRRWTSYELPHAVLLPPQVGTIVSRPASPDGSTPDPRLGEKSREREPGSCCSTVSLGRTQEAPQGKLLETHASELAGDAVKVSPPVEYGCSC